ncbi:hypothetical protein [Tateyamaria sp.]|uniref:hypothetical protein n=1 Tax=Tateyamaria sp. TaxID=1929288 RepID=UPI00329A9852
MNSLQTRGDALCDDLETNYRHSLTDTDHQTLHKLDAAAIDGTLTNASFERTQSNLMANRRRSYTADHRSAKIDPAFQTHRNKRKGKLFGDYELIIDTCLDGAPVVKNAVLKADIDGRRGLASLKYHLRKAKAFIPQDMATILRICEGDQEYHEDPVRQAEAATPDMKNIEARGGCYRVSVMVNGKRHRETFEKLHDARQYRDRQVSVKVPA